MTNTRAVLYYTTPNKMASRSSTDIVLAVTTALTFISAVQANYRRCGIWDCYGTGVYCCGDSCCYHVYSHWWFWSIWALGIAIVMSVVYGCCRARRRRAANAGIIVQHAQPVYGASSATTYAYTGPAGDAQSNYNPYANQPTAAPPSAPAYQEKPPAYMP